MAKIVPYMYKHDFPTFATVEIVIRDVHFAYYIYPIHMYVYWWTAYNDVNFATNHTPKQKYWTNIIEMIEKMWKGKKERVYTIQIWTDPEGNIRLYGPRESNIAQGRRPRAILLSLGPYNLICSRDQSIFVLLYDHWQMEEALSTNQTDC